MINTAMMIYLDVHGAATKTTMNGKFYMQIFQRKLN